MLLDGSVKEFKGFVAQNGVEGDNIIKELLQSLEGLRGEHRMVATGDYVVYRLGDGQDEEIFVARVIASKW